MKKKLIVLSIDALSYDDLIYLRTLSYVGKVFEKGAWAVGGMRCIYPTLTYPAHASMITGCYPDAHGIFHNEVLDVGNKFPDWKWYRSYVKAENVLDVAKKAGLTTGCVNWPTMASAPNVDYLIPELWSEDRSANQCEVLKSGASPSTHAIIDKYFFKWNIGDQPQLDYFMTSCSCEIIKQNQPDVMFIHLAQLDHTKHDHGIKGFATEQALIVLNENFGRIVEAVSEAGNEDITNYVIVGDHGQIRVDRMFNPNVVFAGEGLISVDENGKITDWKAWCHSAAMSCQVILRDPKDSKTKDRVYELISGFCDIPEYGVEGILTKEECQNIYHLSGDFEYVMEGNYISFGERWMGDVVEEPTNENYKYAVASHGYMPHKGSYPAFIAAGPDFVPGPFERKNMVDEAPTYAAVFGLKMPDAQGEPINKILCKH